MIVRKQQPWISQGALGGGRTKKGGGPWSFSRSAASTPDDNDDLPIAYHIHGIHPHLVGKLYNRLSHGRVGPVLDYRVACPTADPLV